MSHALAEPFTQKPPEPRPLSSYLVPLLCIAFAAAMALLSTGFLEADEITHYLYARAIWHDPYQLVSIWGRMGCSALYGLAAPAGIIPARLLAVAVTALTAHGTALLLRHFTQNSTLTPQNSTLTPQASTLTPQDSGLKPPPWLTRHATALAWLLFFAQPCVLLNSFTVMTEMLLACTWVWSAVVLAKFDSRRGLLLAAFILGLGGLMRPEGWLAIAAWPIFLYFYRRPKLPTLLAATFLAGLPPLTWYLLGAHVWHTWDWVRIAWPWAAKSPYGTTALLFLLSSLVAPAIWMWFPILKAARAARRTRNRHAIFLLIIPAAAFFLAHGILGSAGLFGSLSLPRYFQSVAPMLAVLAALGIGQLAPTPRALKWILPLSLVPLCLLAALRLLPMQAVTEQDRLDLMIHEIQTRHIPHDQLLIRHPYPLMRLNIDLDAPAQVRVLSKQGIATAPAGSVLLVDSTVWSYENSPSPDELKSYGYVMDQPSAARVDQIPQRFEPLTFHNDPNARVRLWIKQ